MKEDYLTPLLLSVFKPQSVPEDFPSDGTMTCIFKEHGRYCMKERE